MIEKAKLEIKGIVCEEYWQYLCAGQLPRIGNRWILPKDTCTKKARDSGLA